MDIGTFLYCICAMFYCFNVIPEQQKQTYEKEGWYGGLKNQHWLFEWWPWGQENSQGPPDLWRSQLWSSLDDWQTRAREQGRFPCCRKQDLDNEARSTWPRCHGTWGQEHEANPPGPPWKTWKQTKASSPWSRWRSHIKEHKTNLCCYLLNTTSLKSLISFFKKLHKSNLLFFSWLQSWIHHSLIMVYVCRTQMRARGR